jgi:hypothetical protein
VRLPQRNRGNRPGELRNPQRGCGFRTPGPEKGRGSRFQARSGAFGLEAARAQRSAVGPGAGFTTTLRAKARSTRPRNSRNAW